MSKVDWSKAPEWAECVVIPSYTKFSTDYFWSEKPTAYARMIRIETGVEHTMNVPVFWTIIEERPVDVTSKTTMSKIDWSKAPEWATCAVIQSLSTDYFWSEKPRSGARMMDVQTGFVLEMKRPEFWEIVEERPNIPTLADDRLIMTPKAGRNTYEQFIANGWNDDQLIESGYATRLSDDLKRSPTPPIEIQPSSRCAFTPVEQPSTAPELLNRAAQLLVERGKQYDKSGEERSAAAIVAAFNIITKRDLTPGEGWLFMVLLKAVRFYSNTETPHRDSLEDMIAFAALHAEEYLNDK